MRSAVLTVTSLTLTMAVIGNAYYQRQQFYPSVVYITKSNASMAVIYVQAFVFVYLLGKLMRKLFFGQLRPAEFEHLLERSWYAVTETCLAFTVFKDDMSPKFVALFTMLLFLKYFHWLAEERVDLIERSPSISLLFHVRVLTLAAILAAIDTYLIVHAYQSTVTNGVSVLLVFGFEFAILLTIVVNTVVKYALHSIDLYTSETPWENKAVFMLYTDLALGCVKVLLYLMFMVIMVRLYTLPLFAVRPMYLTMRTFKKTLNDIVMSRRAINNMNTWYADATEEELANTDNVCIICREEMLAPSTKKLPCNHIFHKACLRSWFQRQQTCPTCRLDVLRIPIQRPPHPRAQPAPRPNAPFAQPPQAQAATQPPPPASSVPSSPATNTTTNAASAAAPPPLQPTALDPNMRAFFAAMAGGTRTGAPSPDGAWSSARPPLPPPSLLPLLLSAPPFFSATRPVPPPMPPPDFSGLTTEELIAMEGHERHHIEARIQCLRNIQVLLDAAVMEMQQYSSVVARLPAAAPASQDQVSNTKSHTSQKDHSDTGARPKMPSASANGSDSLATASAEEVDASEIISKMDDVASEKDEQSEVRRRRLEKFCSDQSD